MPSEVTKKERRKKWLLMTLNASDDVTDKFVCSERYILAGGRKVHGTGMQTGVLGGKRMK